MPSNINENYKKIMCIEKMEESYKERFFPVVTEYAPRLSNRILLDGSVYTLHNFNEHCYDIYNIISNVLLDEELAYTDNFYSLSQKELFLLNLAVLFHDISMSDSLTVDRKAHSVESAKYVRSEWESDSVLRKCADITKSELYALEQIIIAHSDVKDNSVPPNLNGLKSPELSKEYIDKDSKRIRVRELAAILRVADEMDVTANRLGPSVNLKKQLELLENKYSNQDYDSIPADIKELIKSLEHWRKLELFSCIKPTKGDNIAVLVVDDTHYQKLKKEGVDRKRVMETIMEVYNSISNRLTEAVDLVFSKSELKRCIPITSIDLEIEDEVLNDSIKKELSNICLKEQTTEYEAEDGKTEEQCACGREEPTIIDEGLAAYLSNEVKNRELLTFGHFKLSSIYCARDWINTKELVETRTINYNIVSKMSAHIKKNSSQDAVIIGVGLMGTILASRIAFVLQRPLSYIFSEKDSGSYAEFEKKSVLTEVSKVILITDVIVTYESLKNACQKAEISDKVEAIYSIFYRKSDYSKSDDWLSKTHCLNSSFDIELFEKKNCKYSEKCIAKNRTISSFTIRDDQLE